MGSDKNGRPFSAGRSSSRATTSRRDRLAGIFIINALVRRIRSRPTSGLRKNCWPSTAASLAYVSTDFCTSRARWSRSESRRGCAGVALSDAIERCSRVAPTRRSTFPSVSLKSREGRCNALSNGKSSTRTVWSARGEPHRVGKAAVNPLASSSGQQIRGDQCPRFAR